jgi:hypothetical protein
MHTYEPLIDLTAAPVADGRAWRASEGMRLAAQLKKRRTVLWIARQCGCADSTIHDYAAGRRVPSRTRLAQLRALLGESDHGHR